MTLRLDRRRLVMGGGLGLAALALPGGAPLAQQLLGASGFTHGVASGEPGPDSMLLWSRYALSGGADEVRLDAEIALDPDFRQVAARGVVRTGPWRDWTAKITLDGLNPGTTYWYRFIGPDGSMSQTGRARTLPVGRTERFRIGLFSCSNLPMGWFNAYAHAAARDDVDLWLHVGDYVYEYGIGSYAVDDRIAERAVLPAHDHEMATLADYRLRFACYRADPDLQALHAAAPMVCVWDDHESTNDSWEGGAQNHQPATEGDWSTRRAAAVQAYLEWMPISEEPWKSYPIGDLATLYRTESRLIGRTRQADIGAAYRKGTQAALAAFRDGVWQDASATMLGSTQEAWLARELRINARNTGWQVVGMGTIMGRTVMPQDAVSWLRPDLSEGAVRSFVNATRAGRVGLPMWMDRWDGYPAARSRFLRAAQAADADLVMLSGDSHNAWAYSLSEDGRPAGVEFAGQAVTSNGIEKQLGVAPSIAARSFVAANPEMNWAQASGRGYMMIDITPERVDGEWIFMETIKARSAAVAGVHRMAVEKGRRRFLV